MFGCGLCFNLDESMIRLKRGQITSLKQKYDDYYEQKLKDHKLTYRKISMQYSTYFNLDHRYVPIYTREDHPEVGDTPILSCVECEACGE